ncbi:siderophore ABC transporter substrate-binding protein [Utexia brackfieldae]|uniref:siderophore ABC transporter substrate-binding protein n=1 Tax=Utexia brackfieldae TaxID=3074108 RepID=UPI00370D3231
MLKKAAVTVLSLSLAFTLFGCDKQKLSATEASPQMITIAHVQGTTSVPINPQKVVVFNPATLDTMDALGIKIAAVPQTSVHFPAFLQKYAESDYVNVGGLFEPNYEALSNLKPDLIIAGGRANDAYDKLSEIAPTISLAVDNHDFIDSLTLRTEQLGEIFDKQAEAEKQITQFKQKIAAVKARASDQGTALIILINGGKMSAYGPGSRFGFIYDELGFKPATKLAESGTHGNIVNAEFLLNVNPDWLFVLDRDSAIGNNQALSAKQVLDNPLIHKTKVWQDNKIVYLDSSALYIAGGLQTYNQLLDQINQVLGQQ